MKRLMMCLTIATVMGCGQNTTPNVTKSTSTDPASAASTPTEKTWIQGRLLIDPNTGEPQTCTGPSDPSCNAQGPGWRKTCDVDMMCRLYLADDACTYQNGLSGEPMLCEYVACGNDAECDLSSPNAENLLSECVFTTSSFASDPGGVCAWWYKSCEVMTGTPCMMTGVLYEGEGGWVCSAEPDMSKAATEVCDGSDNDCDGDIDEGFTLGTACDGSDTDQCKNGTWTCAADKLGVECVNESATNIVESCDSADNDCDGEVDEDFAELGNSCDGADADLCKTGTYVCSEDGSDVICDEPGVGFTELCDSADNDCDGSTDEGCDDDSDNWCDSTMDVAEGASCVEGDCNDLDSAINPDAAEKCNGKDDNCDESTDEGFGLGNSCSAGSGVCLVAGTYDSCAPDGASAVCSAQADMTKATVELCDGLDNDCDGSTDEGCDDDHDGWCDSSMEYAAGAACTEGDCNDTDASVYPSAPEQCNAMDNDCDGVLDEGCDDDNDGWCDFIMQVWPTATCTDGDCDDANANINPDVEEICTTPYDDNCDGNTELKSDGTPVCDSCANVLKLPCDTDVTLDMAAQPNTANAIDTYSCMTKVGPKTLSSTFSAAEIIIQPDAEAGTEYSLWVVDSGAGTVVALLHGSCEPDEGTSQVSPFKDGSAVYTGTCAKHGYTAVDGGVVGNTWVSIDAPTPQTVTVMFVCDN